MSFLEKSRTGFAVRKISIDEDDTQSHPRQIDSDLLTESLGG